MSDISKIDKNLLVESVLKKDGISFYDVRKEPFSVYGLYDCKNQPIFRRMPEDVASATNDGVVTLAKNTSGGRVRFSTDSPFVCIKVTMNTVLRFSQSVRKRPRSLPKQCFAPVRRILFATFYRRTQDRKGVCFHRLFPLPKRRPLALCRTAAKTR